MNTKKIAEDPSKYDWTQFDAISDEEAEANALSDPDNPLPRLGHKPVNVMARVQVIRRALGLTQEEFASRYQIPLGTLRDWELHCSEPDQPARTYLKLIATDPEAIAHMLQRKKSAAA
jgi:putative transcriptional regulator